MIVLFEILFFILVLYCIIYIPFLLLKKFVNVVKGEIVDTSNKSQETVTNPEQLTAGQLIALWNSMNKGIQEERHKKLYQRVQDCLSHLLKKTDSEEYQKVKTLLINDFSPLIVNFSTLPKSMAYKKVNEAAPVDLFIENYELLTIQLEELTEKAFSNNIKDMRVQNKYMKNNK